MHVFITQILSAVVAATIADMYSKATDAPSDICDEETSRLNDAKDNRDRAPRICFLGGATSIISVLTALTLIQIEMIAICAPGTVSMNVYNYSRLFMCVCPGSLHVGYQGMHT